MLNYSSQQLFTLKKSKPSSRRGEKVEFAYDKPINVEKLCQAFKNSKPLVQSCANEGPSPRALNEGLNGIKDPLRKRAKHSSEESDEGRAFVDVIQLNFEISFQANQGNGWREAMTGHNHSLRLLGVLEKLGVEKDSLIFDIGDVDLGISLYSFEYEEDDKELLRMIDEMVQTKRVRKEWSTVRFIAHPLPLEENTANLPFKLQFTVTISLITPYIFEPVDLRRYPMVQLHFFSKLSRLERSKPHHFRNSVDMTFFISSMNPAPALPSALAGDAAQPDALLPCLLPFQRNSVGWLLQREGKAIGKDGKISSIIVEEDQLPLFWEKVKYIPNQPWFLNTVTGQLLPHRPANDEFAGGILAEEPGLGKTLESVALVLLNPARDREPSKKKWDPVGKVDVREVKTTLIVTPDSLQQQWIDEIATHAPSLKVMVYRGWDKSQFHRTMSALPAKHERDAVKLKGTKRKRDAVSEETSNRNTPSVPSGSELADAGDEVPQWSLEANGYDIWITTYAVLARELPVARAPVTRPRREVATYSNTERLRSPLVKLEWFRVIMDEVQMVGGGKTEEMVSLIPRLSSFAVSGTPARSKVDDLQHVLKFLRVDAVLSTPGVWSRLQTPEFASQFAQLFNRIGIRTVKAKVKDQLTIPEQRRFLVPIDLGRVERQVYAQALEQALKELGMDIRGVARTNGWQLDVGLLRSWIRRLRGICTHPLVGQLTARQVDDLRKPGALKTIGEVLESMKDTNLRQLLDDRKAKILNTIRRARLIQHDPEVLQRHQTATDLLLTAKKEMETLCTELRGRLAEQEACGETLKREAAFKRAENSAPALKETQPGHQDEGKHKAREGSDALTDDSSEDIGLPKTPAGDECKRRIQSFQSRLRECEIVMHQIMFFLGDTYNVLGNAAREEETYAEADDIRKRLLQTSEDSARSSMAYLRAFSERKAVSQVELSIEGCGKGGIKSDHLLREADDLIDILNRQTGLLFTWRQRIFDLLTEDLVKKDEEKADGEEFARSLETQGVAETYLQAYSALIADRREVMLLERSALAAHDARELKLRQTAAAKKAAESLYGMSTEQDVAIDLEPDLHVQLATARKNIMEAYDKRALRSIIVDLMHVVHSIAAENDPEKLIAQDWASQLRRLIAEQGKLHERLEADLVQFRKTFNDRVVYFRQLQELSDSVTPVEWEQSMPVAEAVRETYAEETRLDAEINTNRARLRYLTYLSSNSEGPDDEENICVLCKCDFIRGYITHCAHVFCEECFKAWTMRREGKACPVCRAVIDHSQLQRISMLGKQMPEKVVEAPQRPRDEPAPKTKRIIEYDSIDPFLFDEIQKVETNGSYGSKIESIVRHLLYIEEKQPGSKSIVFTAWAHSLHILEHALTANGITCLRIDQKRGRENAAKVFRTDPNILVLLLHGERENAGLNVTCASRVFLVEPVVHHGFEIQAIARIDRMGQTRPTEVYCYYAEDTVEKNILDLAAKRGVSLYTKGHATGTLNVTTLELDAKEQNDDEPSKVKAKQKGDFNISANDMLTILFPHLFEDIEYLVPPADGDVEMFTLDEPEAEVVDGMDLESEQPVAGPSRLAR